MEIQTAYSKLAKPLRREFLLEKMNFVIQYVVSQHDFPPYLVEEGFESLKETRVKTSVLGIVISAGGF